jgi:hypothetical protein
MEFFLIVTIYALLDLARHAVAKWLRHCAIHRKVAGSIPDGSIGIFQT